jgi:hypothetical protein
MKNIKQKCTCECEYECGCAYIMTKPKPKLYYSVNQILNYLRWKNDDWYDEFKTYYDNLKNEIDEKNGDLIFFKVKVEKENLFSDGLKKFLIKEFGTSLNLLPQDLYA